MNNDNGGNGKINHRATGYRYLPGADWKAELASILKEHNHVRSNNGEVASNRTQEARHVYLFKAFGDLRAMGFKVSPYNIKEKHVRALCQKYEADKLAAATIQTYISFLRAFCVWIEKPGMIRDLSNYFTNPEILKRTYAALEDKSWEAKDIDKSKVFGQMMAQHPYVWIQLLMEDAFGLRRKEAIRMRPVVSDVGDGYLHVFDGAKGGKQRAIKIESDYQREVLQRAKSFVGNATIPLGDPGLDLKQNLNKYSNVIRRAGIKKTGKDALGITGHGLRAGFALNAMEAKGLVPIIRGGSVGALPKTEEMRIRLEVSRMLGHNRVEVTAAYGGAFTVRGVDMANSSKAEKLAGMIVGMTVGEKYTFELAEHSLPDGEVIPSGRFSGKFLGMVKVEGAAYFEVELAGFAEVHKIAVGIVLSITPITRL